MASNQTEHYGLNQWEGSDDFLRTEFNEDNRRVDAAMAGKCEVRAGKYIGDGVYPRTISLGGRPKAVLVEQGDGTRPTNTYLAGLCVDGGAMAAGTLIITDDGFQIDRKYGTAPNSQNAVFFYVAFL
ncbi:MAG: hypothetical protein EOM52_07210 [Clostridia bacterium]|nr:hypothetical protein [Clostridia bacterium]